jgi:hypothetical protein
MDSDDICPTLLGNAYRFGNSDPPSPSRNGAKIPACVAKGCRSELYDARRSCDDLAPATRDVADRIAV